LNVVNVLAFVVDVVDDVVTFCRLPQSNGMLSTYDFNVQRQRYIHKKDQRTTSPFADRQFSCGIILVRNNKQLQQVPSSMRFLIAATGLSLVLVLYEGVYARGCNTQMIYLVFTAIECASSALRLQMPSRNNVETMFVQHYLEKGPTVVGVWQLATSRQ
jgi:hypothetical protein